MEHSFSVVGRRPNLQTFRVIALAIMTVSFWACGQSSQYATVTLITGLENKNAPKNLMTGLVQQMSITGAKPACRQTQIVAGFGLSSATGQSNNLSFYPVNLSTTVSPSFESSYPYDAASWLYTNSDLAPVSVPAPVGVPLDFGILGALIAPGNSTGIADGDACPFLNNGTSNATYSFIGHATATISGNTTIPIKTWILNAASGLPLAAATGTTCNDSNGSSNQNCPNQDYNFVKLTGSCSTALVQRVRFEYAIGTNGNLPVTQVFDCTTLNTGVRIPSIKPMRVYAIDSSGTVLNAAPTLINDSTLSNWAATSLSFYSSLTLTIVGGGGVTNPGTTQLNYSIAVTGPFSVTLNWSSARYATDYTVTRYTGACPGTGGTAVATNTALFTATDASLASNTYCYTIVARNGVVTNPIFGPSTSLQVSF